MASGSLSKKRKQQLEEIEEMKKSPNIGKQNCTGSNNRRRGDNPEEKRKSGGGRHGLGGSQTEKNDHDGGEKLTENAGRLR